MAGPVWFAISETNFKHLTTLIYSRAAKSPRGAANEDWRGFDCLTESTQPWVEFVEHPCANVLGSLVNKAGIPFLANLSAICQGGKMR